MNQIRPLSCDYGRTSESGRQDLNLRPPDPQHCGQVCSWPRFGLHLSSTPNKLGAVRGFSAAVQRLLLPGTLMRQQP